MSGIGAYIKHLRLVREPSWSLRDVSRVTGLSIGYLSELERGMVNPSLDALETIASAYGKRSGDLLTEAGYTVNTIRVMQCSAKVLVTCTDGVLAFTISE